MNQEKIWDYFQNEGGVSFEAAQPRYNYLKKRVKKLTVSNAKVLNIGVGAGRLESMLLKSGYLVSALDPNPNSIQKLVSAGVDAHVGMIENLPFDTNTFDVIVASEVLEHLSDDSCRIAISEIQRTLKSKGVFIGTVPYAENLSDNLTVCPHCAERFHRWGHQQSFDKKRLASIFDGKLEQVNILTMSFVVWTISPKRLLKSLLKWLLGYFGEIGRAHV